MSYHSQNRSYWVQLIKLLNETPKNKLQDMIRATQLMLCCTKSDCAMPLSTEINSSTPRICFLILSVTGCTFTGGLQLYN